MKTSEDMEKVWRKNEQKLHEAARNINSSVSGLLTDLLAPTLDPNYLVKNWEALKVLKAEVFDTFNNKQISKHGLNEILSTINYTFDTIKRKREADRYKREKAFEENEREIEKAADRFSSSVQSFDPETGSRSDLEAIKEYKVAFFECRKKGVRKDKVSSALKKFEWARQTLSSKMEQRKEHFEKKRKEWEARQVEREKKRKEWEERQKEKERKQREWEERQRERERKQREWEATKAKREAEKEERKREREIKQREWEAEQARRKAEKEAKQREWEARRREKEQRQREWEERQRERERKRLEWERKKAEYESRKRR